VTLSPASARNPRLQHLQQKISMHAEKPGCQLQKLQPTKRQYLHFFVSLMETAWIEQLLKGEGIMNIRIFYGHT